LQGDPIKGTTIANSPLTPMESPFATFQSAGDASSVAALAVAEQAEIEQEQQTG